jgi:hypothetical protein
VQIKAIFRPYWIRGAEVTDDNFPYLVYGQRFDIVPQLVSATTPPAKIPDPITGMYVVKRALRTDGSRIGDIFPLSRLRVPVELSPQFGEIADTRLKSTNSFEYTSEFLLNKYSDKQIYHSVY